MRDSKLVFGVPEDIIVPNNPRASADTKMAKISDASFQN